MVGYRIAQKAYAEFVAYRAHYRGFPDTGRAYQQHGTLFFAGDSVSAVVVFFEIYPDGVFDFVFSLFYIHFNPPVTSNL